MKWRAIHTWLSLQLYRIVPALSLKGYGWKIHFPVFFIGNTHLCISRQLGLPPPRQLGLPPPRQLGLPPPRQLGLPPPRQLGLPSPTQPGLPPPRQPGLTFMTGTLPKYPENNSMLMVADMRTSLRSLRRSTRPFSTPRRKSPWMCLSCTSSTMMILYQERSESVPT